MALHSVAWLQQSRFIQKIKELPFVEKIILFGSRARGDNTERSDLDLAVICPKASTKDWFVILEILDHAETLLPIDCLRFDKIDAALQQKIKKEGIEL